MHALNNMHTTVDFFSCTIAKFSSDLSYHSVIRDESIMYEDDHCIRHSYAHALHVSATVSFNTLVDVAGYIRHKTFINDVILLAMSLGLTLCTSREAGQGEVGGCTQRVQTSTAWSCQRLALKKPLGMSDNELGRPFLSSFARMG